MGLPTVWETIMTSRLPVYYDVIPSFLGTFTTIYSECRVPEPLEKVGSRILTESVKVRARGSRLKPNPLQTHPTQEYQETATQANCELSSPNSTWHPTLPHFIQQRIPTQVAIGHEADVEQESSMAER